MDISSRPPDEVPNQCPICKTEISVSPSTPTGEVTCPSCSALLWFEVREPKMVVFTSALEREGQSSPPCSADVGSRVRITQGILERYEGEVSAIDLSTQRITVEFDIFGRQTPVELDFGQIEVV